MEGGDTLRTDVFVGVATAVAITHRSERTLWRMAASGAVSKMNFGGKTKFDLHSLRPYFSIPLSEEDFPMLARADQGDPSAQTDLAVVFLENEKYPQAVDWLRRAVAQHAPEAMSLMGRCYVNGEGVDRDEKLGLLWIARAAKLGHRISCHQMQGIVFGVDPRPEPAPVAA